MQLASSKDSPRGLVTERLKGIKFFPATPSLVIQGLEKLQVELGFNFQKVTDAQMTLLVLLASKSHTIAVGGKMLASSILEDIIT